MERMQSSSQTHEALDSTPGSGAVSEARADAATGTAEGNRSPEARGRAGASNGDSVRAHLYGLFAGLLARPPGSQLLSMLAGIDEPTEDIDEMATAWRMLKLAAQRSDVDAVDDEFHALFIGVGRGELVPFGSWYLTGFMMDRPLAVLRADLAALGIERTEQTHEPEDHAAALCETMALLITSDDLDTDDERRFFKQHLEPWMGVFFADLQTANSACFYRAVGRLGQAFMGFEERYLAMPA